MKPIANFEQLEYYPTLPFNSAIESVSCRTYGAHGVEEAEGHPVHHIALSGECEEVDIVVIWNRDTIRFRNPDSSYTDYRMPPDYICQKPEGFARHLGDLLSDFVGQPK